MWRRGSGYVEGIGGKEEEETPGEEGVGDGIEVTE